jgi:5'-nucleotidase
MEDASEIDLKVHPLRIGISTRALFDLEEEHRVFSENGVAAYVDLQKERESSPLHKGAGFGLVENLLKLNRDKSAPIVEVILLSRNSPDLSLRAFKSIEHYSLPIKHGSFTSGRALAPFIPAWKLDLFLSNDLDDVRSAIDAECAAALLFPKRYEETEISEEVRIAFDGDAVVFSAQSDMIYKNDGLSAFLEHEKQNAKNPMSVGPFGNFLKKLSLLRRAHLNVERGTSRVRIAIVTARNAPAHERVILTLRAWDTPADEAHFVGINPKGPILKAFGAHIFFDDQLKHVLGAADVVPSGHVPGPHSANTLIVPAS